MDTKAFAASDPFQAEDVLTLWCNESGLNPKTIHDCGFKEISEICWLDKSYDEDTQKVAHFTAQESTRFWTAVTLLKQEAAAGHIRSNLKPLGRSFIFETDSDFCKVRLSENSSINTDFS